jgi:hypothetical protein
MTKEFIDVKIPLQFYVTYKTIDCLVLGKEFKFKIIPQKEKRDHRFY